VETKLKKPNAANEEFHSEKFAIRNRQSKIEMSLATAIPTKILSR
jgi:hypothetical protein